VKGELGIGASDTAKIVLSNVKVPKGNLIGGKPGQVFPQVMDLFSINRVLERVRVSFEKLVNPWVPDIWKE
jgi:alkylation response protein AidB-like acyl-CoA dehydrogenase